jgi:hypothetical protein
MPPHAHGGGDEEEVIVVRTDGPPFADIKAKQASTPPRLRGARRRPPPPPQPAPSALSLTLASTSRPPIHSLHNPQGKGFDVDYDTVCKHIGQGKLSLSDFSRDMAAINGAYVPTATRCFFYMQAGTAGMLGAFAIFIVMGIAGGTPESRAVIVPMVMALFLAGLASFVYSKWLEQPGIKEGAALVKKLIDDEINPRYLDSRFRVRWAVRVYMQPSSTMHLGKQFLERPIVSIYTLRSPNADGVLTDWTLPEAFLSGLFVDVTAKEADGEAEASRALASPHRHVVFFFPSQPLLTPLRFATLFAPPTSRTRTASTTGTSRLRNTELEMTIFKHN